MKTRRVAGVTSIYTFGCWMKLRQKHSPPETKDCSLNFLKWAAPKALFFSTICWLEGFYTSFVINWQVLRGARAVCSPLLRCCWSHHKPWTFFLAKMGSYDSPFAAQNFCWHLNGRYYASFGPFIFYWVDCPRDHSPDSASLFSEVRAF